MACGLHSTCIKDPIERYSEVLGPDRFFLTHVLDVGCSGDVIVRIVDPENLDSYGLSAAVSHCFGTCQNLTLGEDSVEMFKCCISLDRLTKSFRGSVYLFRKLDEFIVQA